MVSAACCWLVLAISAVAQSSDPGISTQPASLSVIAGSRATFMVSATGTAPLGYQWRFAGTNLPSATASSYSLADAQAANGGAYDVVVTNSIGGSVTSTVATLVVSDSPPIITSQPTNLLDGVGTFDAFVVATLGTDPRAYQWSLNGSLVAGATQSFLSFSSLQVSNSGTYSLTISNALGMVTSALASLTVIGPDLYAWTTIAGKADTGGETDGTNSKALFTFPSAITVDSHHNLFVSDRGGSRVRQVTRYGTNWSVTTLGSGLHMPFTYVTSGLIAASNGTVYATYWQNGGMLQFVPSGAYWKAAVIAGGNEGELDGTNGAARFSWPQGPALDAAGSIFVADATGETIRKLRHDGTNWVVSTIAGQSGAYGLADGTNNAAVFSAPSGVAFDSLGNLFVSDQNNSTIRKLTPIGTNWVASTLVRPHTSILNPGGLAVDGLGTVYTTGPATMMKLVPVGTNWVLMNIGGIPYNYGNVDGMGTAAEFRSPNGVAVDTDGTLYVVDYTAFTIRMGVPVQPTPVIDFGPVDALARRGDAASFSVVPFGVQPMFFQWRFNGQDIPGATNATLQLSNVQVASAGKYSVVVSNSFGMVTSSPAALTLRDPPTLSASLNPGGGLDLNFPGLSNATYNVMVSTNLLDWELLGPAIPTAPGSYQFHDRAAVGEARRFYRVRSR